MNKQCMDFFHLKVPTKFQNHEKRGLKKFISTFNFFSGEAKNCNKVFRPMVSTSQSFIHPSVFFIHPGVYFSGSLLVVQ